MNQDNKKVITFCFMVLGVTVGYVAHLLSEIAAASLPTWARLISNNIVSHGVPFLIGAGLFVWLQFSKKNQIFAEEVVVELKKMVWPSRKDTVGMTVAVCIMVLVAGVVFGAFDFLSGYFIKMLVGVR